MLLILSWPLLIPNNVARLTDGCNDCINRAKGMKGDRRTCVKYRRDERTPRYTWQANVDALCAISAFRIDNRS